jgi:hypothetical protein
MDLIWIIYFIDVLSSGGGYGALAFLTLICSAGLVGFRQANYSTYDSDNEDSGCYKGKRTNLAYNSIFKWMLTTFIVLVLLESFLPSKNTAYKMLAAYGATELAQTDEAARIGSKSLEVLEKFMDDYLKESESK